MFGTLLAALLVAQQPPAQTGAPQPYWSQGLTRLPPGELKVVVAAPVYQPDGATNAETATMTGAGPNVVHLFGRRSICDVAVTGAAPPSDAKFGWRLTAQTLSATDALVVVSVDWQRLWDRGQKIGNGPSGTVQLSLHPGDRIPLDLILNPLATEACRAVSLGLEMRLARTAPDSRTPDSSLLPLGATEGGAAVLDADLWLVQRPPSGIEQAHHQSVSVPAQGASFSFPSVTVPTARGDVTVEVGGSFKRYKAPAGNEYLFVSMTRGLAGAKMPAGGTFRAERPRLSRCQDRQRCCRSRCRRREAAAGPRPVDRAAGPEAAVRAAVQSAQACAARAARGAPVHRRIRRPVRVKPRPVLRRAAQEAGAESGPRPWPLR